MKVLTIIDEQFGDYYKPQMFIGCVNCDFKCAREGGFDPKICQNHLWKNQPLIEISPEQIIRRYLHNPITSAIVFGGLEPMLQKQDIFDFISCLREKGNQDDVVIYTGYYPEELCDFIKRLKKAKFQNIFFKFGRFVPNQKPHYDEVLKVDLASDNQFAQKIC